MGIQDRKSSIVKKLEHKVKLAIYNYGLIDQGDRVMVGVSGGKDSMAMLDLLVSMNRILTVKFHVEACHVQASDMPYKADEDFLVTYCAKNRIPLHFRQIRVDFDPSGRKPACFICSWKRRKELFAISRERSCTKLAFGHHLDDAVETLLMNMIQNSIFSSIPPKLSMFDGDLFLIRPLILAQNEELIEYSECLKFPDEISICPHANKTHREKTKELMRLADKLNKNSRENIFRSMGSICEDYIVKSSK